VLAADRYDLTTAQTALKEAEYTKSDLSLNGAGPYILGWAPSTTKGQKNTSVLIYDLSTTVVDAHFREEFRDWDKDIAKDPSTWINGFSLEKLRRAVRNWADKTGLLLTPHGSVTKEE
jgi:hypothetical protein